MQDHVLAADMVEFLCQKDWLGRPKFRPFRSLKRLPKISVVREYFKDGEYPVLYKGLNADDVKSAVKAICQACTFISQEICPRIPND